MACKYLISSRNPSEGVPVSRCNWPNDKIMPLDFEYFRGNKKGSLSASIWSGRQLYHSSLNVLSLTGALKGERGAYIPPVSIVSKASDKWKIWSNSGRDILQIHLNGGVNRIGKVNTSCMVAGD